MSRPWMPLYVADYLADTAHLNATESGAYLHLIMHYWQHHELPDDERKLAQIAKLSAHQWKKLSPTLKQFFHDGWKHKRIDGELAKASEISEKRSAAAKSRHAAAPAKAPANSLQLDTQPQPQSPTQKKDSSSLRSLGRSQATRPVASQDFDDFWSKYPKREGSNPKEPARKKFIAAVKSGADPAEIIRGAEAYADEQRRLGKFGTSYVVQATRWFNEQRWKDYAGPQPCSTGPPAHLTGAERAAWVRTQLEREANGNGTGNLLEEGEGVRGEEHDRSRQARLV